MNLLPVKPDNFPMCSCPPEMENIIQFRQPEEWKIEQERKLKSEYLGVRNNVIVIMTKTTGATHELPKHDVAEGVSTPSVRVSAFDILRLFPALLLHSVWETSRVRVRVWGDFEVLEEIGILIGSDKGGVK